MDNYKNYLNNKEPVQDQDNDEEFKKEQEKLHELTGTFEDMPIQKQAEFQMNNKKFQISEALGEDIYEKVYDLLKKERQKGTDEKIVQQKINKIIKINNKAIGSLLFELDQIVMTEVIKGI